MLQNGLNSFSDNVYYGNIFVIYPKFVNEHKCILACKSDPESTAKYS